MSEMRHVSGIADAGTWDRARAADRVVLDAADRVRRRIVLTTEKGQKLLLDFPEPMMLRDGDGLVLDDGSVVVVAGEKEALVEISAKAPLDLVRLAWHIGNRHTDAQFTGKALPHPARSRAGGDGEGARCGDEGDRGAVRSGTRRAARASSRMAEAQGQGARPIVPAKAGTAVRWPKNRMPAFAGIERDEQSHCRPLPPDGVALARLSGRRVLVFQRHRVGSREWRHRRCGELPAVARCCHRKRERVLRCGPVRACTPRRGCRRRKRAANRRRTRGGLRALEGASSRNHRAGPRLHRGDARRMAMRGARPARAGLGWAGRLSGRRRCHGCRPWHRDRSPRSPPICTPSPRTSSRRACGSFRSGRPTGNACWRRWSRLLRQPPLVRSQRRSINSAARRSAQTSPACATKPSTRGCSGRDPQFRHRRA